jgi:predicted ATPase/DNA-binding winged helix-turn-helix (wHTH) protein
VPVARSRDLRGGTVTSVRYRCGAFAIDADNRRFSCDGAELVLEHKVFAVVLQLVARPGQLVARTELLDAVWGHRYVTPSTLNRVIALARRAFGDDTDTPHFIQTVHGVGYRFIGAVERLETAPAQIAAVFAPPPKARLPARLEALIGREDELAQLAQLLAAHRAVTVLGTGGMGKTQCALEFARRRDPAYPDGVWFFDLAPLHNADEWLQAMAAALSIAAEAGGGMLERVCAVLRGRRALVVLDNCDRVAAEVGALVFAILSATDQLQFLATSQQPLSYIGEVLLRMPPLAVPEASGRLDERQLPAVEAAPAVALLLARVRAIQPGFALTTANAASVVEICRRLDGMPLALELAAARFALLSPEQVLERLQHRFRFLASDAAGRDERHRNLLSLLEWSYSLLSPSEQLLLSWLSVFVQGWTMEAAIDVAAALGRDPEAAVDLLSGLAGKSLVTVDPSLTPPRYRLLESVREFALEQLRASGDETAARDAHLASVRRLSEASHREMLAGRMRERIALLVHEHANIDAALEHALHADRHCEAAAAIVGALMLHMKAHGAYAIGLNWCERVVQRLGPDETVEQARALLASGVMAMHAITPSASSEHALPTAARIARAHGDLWTEAYASGYQALRLANAGRADEATLPAERAGEIAAQLGDPLLAGLAGLARGWICLARGSPAEAAAELRAVRDLGCDFHQQHFIDMYIGLALFALGDLAGAAGYWHEALRRGTVVANIRGLAGSVEGCAYLAARRGRLRDAGRLLGTAGRIRDRTARPLFSFWLPYHQQAAAEVRAGLGGDAYEACVRQGQRARDEDAINEAALLLREFSGAADAPT